MNLNHAFGINDYTTMHFGGSVFDLRYFSLHKKMFDYVYNSLDALNKGHYPDIFAGTLWMTSDTTLDFSWRERSTIFNRCYECLSKDGFLHTTNFPNPEAIPFIFSHMRWIDGDVICKEPSFYDLSYYGKGIVDKIWTVDPIAIKWFLKNPGGAGPDYLYVLGGSPELFHDFNASDEAHVSAFYGFYKYLTIAKDKIGLTTVYEKNGSMSTPIDIDQVIEQIKEQIHEIL